MILIKKENVFKKKLGKYYSRRSFTFLMKKENVFRPGPREINRGWYSSAVGIK